MLEIISTNPTMHPTVFLDNITFLTPKVKKLQVAVLDGDGVPVLALESLSGADDSLCASSGNGVVALYTMEVDRLEFKKSISMSAPVNVLVTGRHKIFCGSVEGDISILEQVSETEISGILLCDMGF